MFFSTKSTLTTGTRNSSFFDSLFNGKIPTELDEDGNIWIDRDPEMFPYILNYLRTGIVPRIDDIYSLRKLCAEADFYALSHLSENLNCAVLDASYDEFPESETEILHIDITPAPVNRTIPFLERNIYFFLRGIELESRSLRSYFFKIRDTENGWSHLYMFDTKKRNWKEISHDILKSNRREQITAENFPESHPLGMFFIADICKKFGLKP